MESYGAESLRQQRSYLRRLSQIAAGRIGLSFLIVAVVCGLQRAEQPRIWFLLLIALGSLGLGSLAGFPLSTFGDEKERFSQSVSVLNGFVGGFALADVSRRDRTTRRSSGWPPDAGAAAYEAGTGLRGLARRTGDSAADRLTRSSGPERAGGARWPAPASVADPAPKHLGSEHGPTTRSDRL